MCRLPSLLLATAALAGCASGQGAPEVSPLDAPPQPANARVRLYADCVRAAEEAGTVERVGRYVRFTCTGAAADHFYAEMTAYARARGLETTEADRRVRYATRLKNDDRCWELTATPDRHGYLIHLPAGDFLDPEKDVPPPSAKH